MITNLKLDKHRISISDDRIDTLISIDGELYLNIYRKSLNFEEERLTKRGRSKSISEILERFSRRFKLYE